MSVDVKEWNREGVKPSYYVKPCPACGIYPKVYKAHEHPLRWAVSHYCDKFASYCEFEKQEDAVAEWNKSCETWETRHAQLSLFEQVAL